MKNEPEQNTSPHRQMGFEHFSYLVFSYMRVSIGLDDIFIAKNPKGIQPEHYLLAGKAAVS
ncbi:hypothetical protein D3C76_1488610 [compost metagenome]